MIRPGRGAIRLTLIAVLMGGLCLPSCAEPVPTEIPADIVGGAPSLAALGDSVWLALTAGDTAALGRLVITRAEHDGILWPGQVAANPPLSEFPLDLAWRSIETRGRAAIRDHLAAFGRSDWRAAGTSCPGETRDFGGFRALTGCRMVIESPAGDRREIELFRQVVQAGNKYKVLRLHSD